MNEYIEKDLRPLWQVPVSTGSDLVIDCETAKCHHGIQEFLALCAKSRGKGLLSFDMLEQRAFMRYWKFLAILRWDEARQDFVFVFFGTGLTVTHGCDFTGCTLAAGDEGMAAVARAANMRALVDHQTVYFSGSLAWRDRSFLRYNGVILPLQRKGLVRETATWVCYL